MLDFQKLVLQIENVGRESLVDRREQEELLERAVAAYTDAAARPDELARRLADNLPWVLWPLAIPLEPFGSRFPVEFAKSPVTVVAADGSQIMPSHHEVYNCYLLNIGTAIMSYGVKLPPRLETRPLLFHKPEDLYPLVDRRRIHIDELYVSLERNLLELETTVSLAITAKRERGLPAVALLDGTLIPWSVDKMPVGYQESYFKRTIDALEQLRQEGLPIFGYLSHSRSSDMVNALRVSICPYEVSHCRELCGELNEEQFPCSKIWPLSDRQMLSTQLPVETRSAAFLSGSGVSRTLPLHQRICFVYVNVGYEVARLEFPRWMLDDRDLFDQALNVVLAQVEKGQGYPVALAEAHHLAVIRGQDRKRFFELIERHLVSLGVGRVKVSPKESRKRKSVV